MLGYPRSTTIRQVQTYCRAEGHDSDLSVHSGAGRKYCNTIATAPGLSIAVSFHGLGWGHRDGYLQENTPSSEAVTLPAASGRTRMQPERLTYSSRGQIPPRRDAAHGTHNTRSRPCRGRINVPSHTPQRIDDPFRVGRFGGGAIRGRRYASPRLLQSRPPACDRRPKSVADHHRAFQRCETGPKGTAGYSCTVDEPAED